MEDISGLGFEIFGITLDTDDSHNGEEPQTFSDILNEQLENTSLKEALADLKKSKQDEVVGDKPTTSSNQDKIEENTDETTKGTSKSLSDIENQEIISIPRKPQSLIAKRQEQYIDSYIKRSKELQQIREQPYFTNKRVLTDAEGKLYRMLNIFLNRKLDNINKSVCVFPKVRIADFIEVDPSMNTRDTKAFYRIACKHVDYLICDSETLGIICAVELDDDYHNRPEKISRDKFVNKLMQDCGIRLFRINERIRYLKDSDLDLILEYVINSYELKCPVCGMKLEIKKARYGKRYGHRFLGCTGWNPDKTGCNYNIDID